MVGALQVMLFSILRRASFPLDNPDSVTVVGTLAIEKKKKQTVHSLSTQQYVLHSTPS